MNKVFVYLMGSSEASCKITNVGGRYPHVAPGDVLKEGLFEGADRNLTGNYSVTLTLADVAKGSYRVCVFICFQAECATQTSVEDFVGNVSDSDFTPTGSEVTMDSDKTVSFTSMTSDIN